jgi:malate dehydrogenase
MFASWWSLARDMLTTTLQSSKVTVLGAAGGIGQPLSLLLKLNPRVSKLSLYDIRLAPGRPLPPV